MISSQIKRENRHITNRNKRWAAPNSGFAQRGDLSSKKSSSCLKVHVTFDALEL
jgi:hypothetical protein